MQLKVSAKDDRGEIWILSDIGESWFGDGVTAKQIADELKALDNVSAIDVNINSYGGDLFDGLAMYTMLKDHKAQITAKVLGIAASAASVVAMAGDVIQVTASGTIMIHDALSGVVGNAADMRRTADMLDAQSQRMAALYARRSKQKSDTEMRDLMIAETWLSADDAIKIGLADAKIADADVSACALPSKHPFHNVEAFSARLGQRGKPARATDPRLAKLRQQITQNRVALGRGHRSTAAATAAA